MILTIFVNCRRGTKQIGPIGEGTLRIWTSWGA